MKSDILNGIRVLDFTRILAGPYATRILGDFGAEVIKVQSRKSSTGAESNHEGYFKTWNRNKKSVTLNLDKQEAKKIVLDLVAVSDIVIENYAPRVMDNWGLNYENLRQARPDLIMLSMSAMGHSGPWKDYVAFGQTIQSFSGFTHLCSYEETTPIGPGNAFGDPVSGLYGALTVLAALEYRDQTGLGQYIDLSEYEAMTAMSGIAMLEQSANDEPVKPFGNQTGHVPAAPHGCYKCKGLDRWCVMAVFDQREWESLCVIMGKPDLIRSADFSTPGLRNQNRDNLDQIINNWTSRHTAEEIVTRLQENQISAGIVQDARDLATDTHLLANDFFVQTTHSEQGATISDRSPIRLNEPKSKTVKSAPSLGEDNYGILVELLGISAEEYMKLIQEGVID